MRNNAISIREREVLEQLYEGHSNAEIGRNLQISEETVKRHLANICDKTGFSTRTEIMARRIHDLKTGSFLFEVSRDMERVTALLEQASELKEQAYRLLVVLGSKLQADRADQERMSAEAVAKVDRLKELLA